MMFGKQPSPRDVEELFDVRVLQQTTRTALYEWVGGQSPATTDKRRTAHPEQSAPPPRLHDPPAREPAPS